MSAVTTSTRVGLGMGELVAASCWRDWIDEGVKTNLRVTRFGERGWTEGLLEFGVKSGVLRGGKRAAELKIGEAALLRSPRAVAAQCLMNEHSVLPSAILWEMHTPITIPPQLNEVTCSAMFSEIK